MTECASVDSGCRLLAGADVVTAETRMINPRKILLRVDLHERIQVYRPETMSLCSGLEAEESLGLQQRVEHYQASCTLSCAEKEFPFEENLTLPGGRSTAAVLRLQPNVYCSESRLIGSKLVVKGGVLLHLLCQGEEGELYTADFDLPFSSDAGVRWCGGRSYVPAVSPGFGLAAGELSPDGRSISVSLELAAQAVFYETLSAAMVTDAYSTYFPVTMRTEELVLSAPDRFQCTAAGDPRVCCAGDLRRPDCLRQPSGAGGSPTPVGKRLLCPLRPVAATVLYLDEAGTVPVPSPYLYRLAPAAGASTGEDLLPLRAGAAGGPPSCGWSGVARHGGISHADATALLCGGTGPAGTGYGPPALPRGTALCRAASAGAWREPVGAGKTVCHDWPGDLRGQWDYRGAGAWRSDAADPRKR